ncbi:MAG: hypothetical protein HC935_08935 [Pseudanabaena sp. SU_2_4]|nr:hypothetical protein [Pseudanabaena sp. SU_2_4]
MTSPNGDAQLPAFNLKIAHEIYSYLLSLEKHASNLVLGFRLIRIAIVSGGQMLCLQPQATGKLTGVRMYCQRTLGKTVVPRSQP